jgi:aryl-alcohol dehydrogenase-like predicted oxidoreductase
MRTLGPYEVYPIGLGAMPLSQGRNVRPSEEQAIATVHAALDAGVTYIDTADIYAPSFDTMGHNERLVANALRAYGGSLDDAIVGTKGGITRPANGEWRRNASLDYLRSAVEASLRALERDVIDLYQWHRPDRSIDFTEGVANFKTLQDEGKVQAIGLSNVNIEEIDIAVQVLGVRADLRLCKTSSRRASNPRASNWTTAVGSGSRSCPGAHSGVSGRRRRQSATRIPSSRRLAASSA